MSPVQLAIDTLNANMGMISSTLADFSDSDIIVRPCPGANHTAWQLGHLIVTENSMLKDVAPKLAPELPAGFAEKFTKETSSKDDAAFFPTKAQLLEQFSIHRNASIAWLKSISDADLAKPTPDDYRNWAPTLGNLAVLTSVHGTMHLGQFQVIRRRLGKPIIF